jgi:hypothetical protein
MMIPKAPRNESKAASPRGNREGESQYSVKYVEKEFFRKIKCSVRTMPAKAADQYPITPAVRRFGSDIMHMSRRTY